MRKSCYVDHKRKRGKENEENEENFSICIIAIVGISALSGCSDAGAKEKTVRIGVTGADGNAWEIVKRKAEKKGLKLN